ncbi:MAG TPA: alpha/beta fold hydrolase [Devosiaceae bacterium]
MFLFWLLTPGNADWSGAKQPAPGDPVEIGYRGDPQAALHLPFTAMQYPTELGPAAAWFVPAPAPSRTWAVFVHGVGGIRENGYRQLAILHDAGIPTLMIDYRNDPGAPQSDPPLFSFGLNEWRDLDAAMGWMLANGADRVIIVAESMGGAIAGQFILHSDKADRVAALVLDAPALDIHGSVSGLYRLARLPFADELATLAIRIAALVSGTPLYEAVTTQAVAGFSGPLFIAHGTADRLVPFLDSQRLVSLRQAPTTTLWTAADHLKSYKENPARYRAELLAFLRTVLAD